ncbi:MAG TPA: nucleoside-diphosphate sugar epimerase/dehydratase [Gammaproteobacteria bacterium]|nr:nucleoside-diphosphate sugar epimerase/dehydratase [Gammaproteobacteria bacterium]
MTRWTALRKGWVVYLHDLTWVPAAVLAAYWIRFNLGPIPPLFLSAALKFTLVALPVHALSFWLFGCYRGIWRFASIPDLLRIGKAVLLGSLITGMVYFLMARLEGVPRSVLVLYPLLLAGGVSASRVLYRAFKDMGLRLDGVTPQRALIVGAGRTGEMLVRELARQRLYIPVAFVDDDRRKHGQELRGVRIRGYILDIPQLVQRFAIDVVLVAMPDASHTVLDNVVQICAAVGVPCRILPALTEIADGRIEVSRIRPVTIEDLLEREPVHLDKEIVDGFLRGRRVLVTGGGGSIGAELCRQIDAHNPELLIVLDHSEFNLYQVERELNRRYPGLALRIVLGDVCDANLVDSLMRRYRPHVIFHAAAYKHVPMVEENPLEGIRNNVFGTRVVADAAVKYGVDRFVLISTDKTVNPINVMGVSKRIAELYCQNLALYSQTHFITTRFGNVLGSTGSVVPLFEQQIREGGPVTVTHPEVTRYFMTLSEAAGLILQAGAMGKGGEIFVLDMGEPVRIRDLAERMIQLSGLRPDVDIRIQYIGLRPGEKLHEELFYEQEELRGTHHPKILLAASRPVPWETFLHQLAALERAVAGGDAKGALESCAAIVPEYRRFMPTAKALAARTLQVVK